MLESGERDLFWYFIFTSKISDNDYSIWDQKIIGIEALVLDNEKLVS